MIPARLLSITLSLFVILLVGCSADESKKEDPVILGKVTLTEGWARPGAEGQNSAAYLHISNGTASKDSIISISSNAAQKTEIHESYKGENGIMGMRPAPGQVIKSGNDLYLKPGSFHIMLMKLTNDWAIGDSIDITITFNRVGNQTIRMPIQIEQ